MAPVSDAVCTRLCDRSDLRRPPYQKPTASAATTVSAAASVGVTTPNTMPPRMITGNDKAGNARQNAGQNAGMSASAPPGWLSRCANQALPMNSTSASIRPGITPATNKAATEVCITAP